MAIGGGAEEERRASGSPGRSAEPSGFFASDAKKSESPAPMAIPTSEPASPRTAPWTRKIRTICAVRVPIALRIPISRGLLDDGDDEDARDAEGDRDDDEELDHPARGALGPEPDEELLVQLHPAVGLQAGPGRDLLRDPLGGEDLVDLQLDRRDAAREVEERLGRAQGDEDPPLVQVLVADVEDARDEEDVGAARRASRGAPCRPTETPRSEASSTPMTAFVPSTRNSPAVIRGAMSMISRKLDGSTPRRATERFARPRSAKAAPATVGAAARTLGQAAEERRASAASRRSTGAAGPAARARGATASPGRAYEIGRTTSSGARTTTWACVPSVLSMSESCSPPMRAERKTMTPTPTPIPERIRMRLRVPLPQEPEGDEDLERHVSLPPGGRPGPAGRPSSFPGWRTTRSPSASPFTTSATAPPRAPSVTGVRTACRPRMARTHGSDAASRTASSGTTRTPLALPDLQLDGEGHVGLQLVGGVGDAQLHVDRPAGEVDARGDRDHLGGERAVGERVGRGAGLLADPEGGEVLLVGLREELRLAVEGQRQEGLPGRNDVARLDGADEDDPGLGSEDAELREARLGGGDGGRGGALVGSAGGGGSGLLGRGGDGAPGQVAGLPRVVLLALAHEALGPEGGDARELALLDRELQGRLRPLLLGRPAVRAARLLEPRPGFGEQRRPLPARRGGRGAGRPSPGRPPRRGPPRPSR